MFISCLSFLIQNNLRIGAIVAIFTHQQVRFIRCQPITTIAVCLTNLIAQINFIVVQKRIVCPLGRVYSRLTNEPLRQFSPVTRAIPEFSERCIPRSAFLSAYSVRHMLHRFPALFPGSIAPPCMARQMDVPVLPHTRHSFST